MDPVSNPSSILKTTFTEALILLPWSNQYWDHNYFLGRYPELIRILLHPSMRGIISGLGVLDIIVAVGLLRRPPQPVAQ